MRNRRTIKTAKVLVSPSPLVGKAHVGGRASLGVPRPHPNLPPSGERNSAERPSRKRDVRMSRYCASCTTIARPLRSSRDIAIRMAERARESRAASPYAVRQDYSVGQSLALRPTDRGRSSIRHSRLTVKSGYPRTPISGASRPAISTSLLTRNGVMRLLSLNHAYAITNPKTATTAASSNWA